MLRFCILLCCGFFSFAVNADSRVPADLFGRTPASVSSNAPLNVSGYKPATVSSPAPASVSGYKPASVMSNTPASVVSSYAPAAVSSNTPVNVSVYKPATVSSNTPASVSSHVPSYADSSIWLLVDTKAHKIEVKQGEQTLETLSGIAIGRKGAGLKGHRGDDITPYGNYRIGWVGEKSNFRKFFGLTYPSTQDAEIALKRGVISQTDYYSIVTAHQSNQIPPQNTPLGGQIGIHGIGAGDERVHQAFDWTHGCIALTNTQIDHLSQWLDTGTVVKIK
jgi:murein L,D-transpeptidase YafK